MALRHIAFWGVAGFLTLAAIGSISGPPKREIAETVPEKEQSTPAQREFAMNLITNRGYSCRLVDMMRPYLFGGGWVVSCNDRQYRYNLEDHGGKWSVEAQ